MWRLLSIAVIVGSVWVLSSVLPDRDEARNQAAVVAIATQGEAIAEPAAPVDSPAAAEAPVDVETPDTAGPGIFAPTSRDISATLTAEPTGSDVAAAPAFAPDDSSAATGSVAALEATPEIAAVTAEPATIEPEIDAAFIVKVQRQLRRVGCFSGKISGRWTARSRNAAATFTERADVALPIEQPSPGLLAQLEFFENRACGTPCGAGFIPNERGRCIARLEVAAVSADDASWSASVAADTLPVTKTSKAGVIVLSGPDAKTEIAALAPVDGLAGPVVEPTRKSVKRRTISPPRFGLGIRAPRIVRVIAVNRPTNVRGTRRSAWALHGRRRTMRAFLLGE